MIDTTEINAGLMFAMGKLSSAWGMASPHVGQLTEKYIRYQVCCAVIPMVVCILGLVAGIIMLLICRGHEFVTKDMCCGSEPTLWMIPLVSGGIAVLTATICLVCTLSPAILAITNPEMYTLHQLIGK